jgi:hypothetical protein
VIFAPPAFALVIGPPALAFVTIGPGWWTGGFVAGFASPVFADFGGVRVGFGGRPWHSWGSAWGGGWHGGSRGAGFGGGGWHDARRGPAMDGWHRGGQGPGFGGWREARQGPGFGGRQGHGR